jgi:capsular polysaccharide biosynthesis protein/MinD-like ATPase involved in chromosome partitioning or flagellar assembly
VELSAVLTILRRWSPTLIASAIIAGVVAYFVASAVPPTYSSESQVLVGPINTDSSTLGASQELVQTYGSLVTSDRVIDYVIEELGLDITPIALRGAITSRAESVTRILSVTALADDPQLAADIANKVAEGLDLVASEGQTRPEGEVRLISQAQASPSTAQPFVPLIAVLAAAAGLVAGLAAVLLIDYFGDTVASREDLQRLTGTAVLGSIKPRRFWQRRNRLVVEGEPESSSALAYRLIAGHVTAEAAKRPLRSIVVMSAEGHEGSGEVAANLAAVLVRTGQRVRLVDANDEDHEITHLFGLRATRALGELAREGADPLDGMISGVFPGIDVIPVPPGRDPRLNDLTHVRTAMSRLTDGADFVVLSTAPIHHSQSALLWAREADGVILVAKRDTTKRDAVTISVESLRMVGTPLLGAVLHAVWRRAVPGDSVESADGGSETSPMAQAVKADVDRSDRTSQSS